MQEHVAPSLVAVDPLIAEAKRRRNRRWPLVATAIGAVALAALGVDRALQAPSHRLTTQPVSRLGIARIPGMTMIAADHSPATCVPFIAGRDAPTMGNCAWNYDVGVSVGNQLSQIWVRRSALAAIGELRLRRDVFGPPALRYPRPLALAGALTLPSTLLRQHPGPMEVQVRVRTAERWNPRRGKTGWAASSRAASGWVQAGLLGGDVGATGVRFIPLPTWTINGGAAGQFDTPWNGGMTRFQFAWAAGTRVVLVDVLGRDLTVRQAQHAAALAGPSTG